MPTITIVNDCSVPLHISLRHISPIHFENNVASGSKATFHTGRVWFTIEARIARGGTDNNEYTLVETYAAPIAVSLCALSLGAGAVWVAGAATAAGGVGAAITSISARIGATAAAQAPTARRLYKYARKGQHIVQVGQVLGIGGGAILGKKAAEAQQQQQQAGPAKSELERRQDEKGGKSWFAWDENARVKEAKRVLKGLLEGSVVSSAGWYMKADRTIRIKGGPRATMMDGLLVIETDTLEPFEVVSDETVEGDGKAAFGDGTGEGSMKAWLSSFSHRVKGKGKDGKDEIRDSQTSFPALQRGGEEKKEATEEETAYQRHQRQLYDKLNESSQWIYSRIRRGPHEPVPVEDAGDVTPSDSNLATISDRQGAPSPAPPPDDDPGHPPMLKVILEEMGFNAQQIEHAVGEVGELPDISGAEEERKEKVEKAILLLLKEESTKAEEARVTVAPTVTTTDALAVGEKPAAIPQVLGAEKVTTPHWTTKARQAVESSPAIQILQIGGSHLVDRGEKWLQKGDGKK